MCFVVFCVPSALFVETLYLRADVWTFSQLKDPLLGPRLWGAPVEEYVFWLGAPWIIMLVYSTLDCLDRGRRRRKG